MRELIIDGARVISEPKETSSGTIFFRIVVNTSQKTGGTWNEVPNYISVFVSKSHIERLTIKVGSSLQMVGPYFTAAKTENGKDYLNISIFPSTVNYSTGSYGTTGMFSVVLTNVGLTTEPISKSSFFYCDGLYDVGFGEKKSVSKARLIFQGAPNQMVGKGKRLDIIGKLSISLNKGEDGRLWVNETIFVSMYNKAPFSPKKEHAQTTQETTSPTVEKTVPNPMAEENLDLDGFEELDDSEFF